MPRPTYTIENAEIMFPNFSGEEKPMNAQGNRNFCLVLPPDLLAELQKVDPPWNIKEYIPDGADEGTEPIIYTQINVSYKIVPPQIWLIAGEGGKRTRLTEETVSVLDSANIRMIDCVITGSLWDYAGKQGTKGYLQSMFVLIEPNKLESKWGVWDGDDGE